MLKIASKKNTTTNEKVTLDNDFPRPLDVAAALLMTVDTIVFVIYGNFAVALREIARQR